LTAAVTVRAFSDAHRDLALPVLGRRSPPDAGSELHLRDRRQSDRYPVRCRSEHHAAEVVQILDEPIRPDDEVFAVVFQVATASVRVRLLQRLGDLRQREPRGLQAQRIDHHLVLAVFSTERVHLDDPRHRAERRTNLPIEQLLELHQRQVITADDELKDFAEPGGDRPEPWLPVLRRHRLLRLAHALRHQLSREVQIGRVVEDDRHHREAVFRERTNLRGARDPGHGALDRDGDVLFDFERRERRRRGDDLHLDVGDVRHGVDGERRGGAAPDEHEEERPEEDDGPISQRPAHHPSEEGHGQSSSPKVLFNTTLLIEKAPSLTTASPSRRPDNTATMPGAL
jgi:hypothetical protein